MSLSINFHAFHEPHNLIEVPQHFTFPFCYEPHKTAIKAAQLLQDYLLHQKNWDHNFGFSEEDERLKIGKMFGVLVVKKDNGTFGYLQAFSGKLANENVHDGFVPPVYDMLTEGSFFLEGIGSLNEMNARILAIENDPAYNQLLLEIKSLENEHEKLIAEKRTEIHLAKAARKAQRIQAQAELSTADFEVLDIQLNKESIFKKKQFAAYVNLLKSTIENEQQKLVPFESELNTLKEQRKLDSNKLQQRLFDEYHFLNANAEIKSLHDIFQTNKGVTPPAGAGECAAPKLLQYAYLNNLQPIALAEFWWGQSPSSEVRKHGQFYPSCMGKCEPILSHMLQGLSVDANPMLLNAGIDKVIETLYEDEYLAVINKPHDLLSVPGINVNDSVAERMKLKYPQATGPLIVHRLDMATSGILLIAKDKETHRQLQAQFIKRTVKKRYEALLDGVLTVEEGIVALPIRVDLEDRPRQLVCYEYGKHAKTEYKVISIENNRTRIHFWPITGRTHQLRLHAAHTLGLNMPIVGDDLYGNKAERLCLHAAEISFVHPITKEKMNIICPSDF